MEEFNLFIIICTYSLVTFHTVNEVDYHVFMYVCTLCIYVFMYFGYFIYHRLIQDVEIAILGQVT